jgi:hypothetical protein
MNDEQQIMNNRILSPPLGVGGLPVARRALTAGISPTGNHAAGIRYSTDINALRAKPFNNSTTNNVQRTTNNEPPPPLSPFGGRGASLRLKTTRLSQFIIHNL